MGPSCSADGEERGVYRVLVGKPEGKRQMGRPRCRWEDNIKMDFRKLEGVVGTGWSWLRIGTDGGTCEYGKELLASIKMRGIS
jgi:hypothetical protein